MLNKAIKKTNINWDITFALAVLTTQQLLYNNIMVGYHMKKYQQQYEFMNSLFSNMHESLKKKLILERNSEMHHDTVKSKLEADHTSILRMTIKITPCIKYTKKSWYICSELLLGC